MKIISCVLFMLTCLSQIGVIAQNTITLSGKITDQHGTPLSLVTIAVENTTSGTYTDDNGRYSLKVSPGKCTLVVSLIGYQTVRSTSNIQQNKTLNFTLEESAVTLNSVEVYGKTQTQKVKEGVFSVNALDIKPIVNSLNNLNDLVNRTTGIKVREEGGVGSDFDLSINGLSGNSIRYFLDGMPLDTKGSGVSLANLPVNIIDRIEIYKGVVPASLGFCDAGVLQKYFGIRAEWVDEVEILRRISIGIYDHDEYEKALAWVRENCKEGFDKNLGKNLPPVITKSKIVPADKDWEFIVKMTLIIRDILYGNPRLDEMGWHEEALGRNAVVGGFQGQRQWTDWLPNADFTEAIMASTFDWNGPKAPTPFATENDTCNGIAMMLGSLVSGSAPCFHDVRTYWSPEACERVTGQKPDGVAANGFIHLINSGATALDGSGACVDAEGNHVMKPFWEMTDADIKACLNATDWCRADYEYFRGGGYSSHFRCKAEMPVTMLRFNIVEGIGPVLQIAEGWTADLPDEIHNTIDKRTDPTWPTTWFCPRLTGQGAFTDVYSVMANWGANHGVTVYGHVGADLITLASMLRIPVTMHNVPAEKVYRPHAWASFGTQDQQAADYAACKQYGPLYR